MSVEQVSAEELVHRVCQWLREEKGMVSDSHGYPCLQCPLTVDSPYGPGTQMCVLRAQELIDIVRDAK